MPRNYFDQYFSFKLESIFISIQSRATKGVCMWGENKENFTIFPNECLQHAYLYLYLYPNLNLYLYLHP